MKISIDPVTRIEGHLKVETFIEGNKVVDAKAHADMYRGIEKALIGYDYLAAIQITQRACGCCPYAHAEAAALAIEDALDIELNKNGKLLRNLIIAGYKVNDYVLHFYTLSSLDFIDVTAILNYKGNSDKLNQFKEVVKRELQSKSIFPSPIFTNRYKGNYLELKELNIALINHYLEHFEFLRKSNELVRIFGSKAPHMVSIEAGGVTTKPTPERVLKYIELLKEVKKFVEEKYIPDVLIVGSHFKEYFKIGKGVNNFLSVNTILDLDGNYLFWDGFSKDFNIPEKVDPNEIIEYQDYSYYKRDGAYKPLELQELLPLSLEEFKQNKKKYSWSKAPRYKDEVVEVGPAAVVINNYLRGNKKVVDLVDKFNKMLGITIKDYNSVMGRHLSRAILSKIIVEKLEEWINLVDIDELGFIQLKNVPNNVRGIGLTEATRGVLAHFTDIGENGFIRNYDMVVPTTWNISPLDGKNRHGALEEMLIGTKVKDPKNPIEIARIIRSIDPCLACSVH